MKPQDSNGTPPLSAANEPRALSAALAAESLDDRSDAFTGPEWLTMRDELTNIITGAARHAPREVDEHRIIGEHLIARGIINPRALAAEVATRPDLVSQVLVDAFRSGMVEVHEGASAEALGCTEAACETVDVHAHGAACGRLCPECRGRDGQ